jgi:aspartate kinase
MRMISQGASEINLSFVVDEEDVPGVIRRLHGKFFAELDPEVFDPRPAIESERALPGAR